MKMNYIGSKIRLIPYIEKLLKEKGLKTSSTVLDLFCGTGVVSYFFKSQGYITLSNDWQSYAYYLTKSKIELNEEPEFTRLFHSKKGRLIQEKYPSEHPHETVLSYLNNKKGKKGAFYEAYCEGGRGNRLYFSSDNGKKIQSIRDQIEQWITSSLISERETAWLISSLIEGSDKVANTTSIYGAYLKKVKKNAQKKLQMISFKPAQCDETIKGHKSYCSSAQDLLKNLKTPVTLTYLDPPYNRRQYSDNYHLLETIAKWDLSSFEPRGQTGLRIQAENKSEFCLSSKVEKAFKKLFSLLKSDYVLLSYNNEGLLKEDELIKTMKPYVSQLTIEKIPYQRYRADQNHENRNYKEDKTFEFLIWGKVKKKKN